MGRRFTAGRETRSQFRPQTGDWETRRRETGRRETEYGDREAVQTADGEIGRRLRLQTERLGGQEDGEMRRRKMRN